MTINWKQSVIVVCDIAIATYLLLAVTAFNKPDAATSCSEVKIDIKAGRVEGFLNASEVKNILSKDKLYPLSKAMGTINPRQIEEALNQWARVHQYPAAHSRHQGDECQWRELLHRYPW